MPGWVRREQRERKPGMLAEIQCEAKRPEVDGSPSAGVSYTFAFCAVVAAASRDT